MAFRPRDVVVVGASAGGVEALQATVGGLPARLQACVLVVLHTRADADSALPAILTRAGPLPARAARHGEAMEGGHIYTATPDHHLLVMEGVLRLSHGPTVRGHRPSIDLLFRSAAEAFGAAVTGVLLSGMLDDGVAGLVAITALGGRTIVQDPGDALFTQLPAQALRTFPPDYVVRAADVGAVLAGDRTRASADPAPPPT